MFVKNVTLRSCKYNIIKTCVCENVKLLFFTNAILRIILFLLLIIILYLQERSILFSQTQYFV